MYDATMITLAEGAMVARLSREALLRRVFTGRVRGVVVAGRWVVSRPDCERVACQAGEPAPTKPAA